jgi:DNA-binding NarL/FixJ family response regulator
MEREGLFSRGLQAFLSGEAGMEVVGMASTVAEGYWLADVHVPHIALIGSTLPDAMGLAATKEFRRRFPSIPAILVTAQETDDELFEAIRCGASAYCGQDVEETKLVALIERAATGEYVINEQLLARPYVASRVLAQFRAGATGEPEPTGVFSPLTSRELEILKRVSDGLTNIEIGYALGISPQTVKNHVTSILRKLAVNDRTQAVITALKRGWLSIDDDHTASPPKPDTGNSAPGAGTR